MSLQNRKVLVTGATGFIGGHLVRRLIQDEGASVTAVGRNLEKRKCLQKTGLTFHQLDLTGVASLAELLGGHDIIFHLAAAKSSSDRRTIQKMNVTATENLVRAASTAGIRRFIQASSMAAYGPPDRPIMDEDHPLDTEQMAPYGRSKAMAELRTRALADELSLELVVIRPGMVFGPGGVSWTIQLVELVKKRIPVIFGDGSGHAHPVYVDNLIDGLILAATRPEAAGESFNFMDQSLPWREFLGAYGQMCGRRPLKVPVWLARSLLTVVGPLIGRSEPPEALLRFYTNKSIYPTTKAERLLGYRRRVGLDEGMTQTEAWLRSAGYI